MAAGRILTAEEHTRLIEQARQLALLTESNEHLREAERKAASRAETAEARVNTLEREKDPSLARLATLKASLAALQAERSSLGM